MEINGDMVEEDVAAVFNVGNSIRANRLQVHRTIIINKWKKKECNRMKQEIIDIQSKIQRLREKKRKLVVENKEGQTEFEKALTLDVPLNYATSALKAQVLEKMKNLENARKECERSIQLHRDCWVKTESYWNNMTKVKIYQELMRQVEDLNQEKERIILEKVAKKEAAQKAVADFQKSVVDFVKMALIYQKSTEVVANNKKLEEKIKFTKEKIAAVLLAQEKGKEVEVHVAPVMEIAKMPILFPYAGMDFVEFDEIQCTASSVAPVSQKELTGESEYEDLNCSVLSLDASMDDSFFHTASMGPSLGAPMETSTPYSLETAHRIAEERAQMEIASQQTASTQQMPQFAGNENQFSIVGGQSYQQAGEMTREGFSWEEQVGNKGMGGKSLQQDIVEGGVATENQQQTMVLNMAGQWQNYSQRSEIPHERYNWEYGQNQTEPPKQMASMPHRQQEILSVGGSQKDGSTEIRDQHRKDNTRQSETLISTHSSHFDEEDVDYNVIYAKSPEDPGLSELSSSPPTRPTMPAFNLFSSAPAPGTAPAAPMSFFGFGPSEPKKASSSIFNLF